MTANTRVSFQLAGKIAYGTTVMDEAFGRCLVAVDPNYMQGAQGTLFITAWFPTVSLTVVS